MIGLLWQGVQQALVYAAIRQAERWTARFDQAARRPWELQEELRRRILEHHRQTRFGREHGFATIRSLADFRRQLPIRGYDAIEPYMAEVRRGRFDALLNTRAVHMFAMTSGTTATRKTIPVTPWYLADYRRGMTIWGLRIFGTYRDMLLKPILQLTSDWQESFTEAGIPCGAVSGLTADMQKRVVRWLYCFPAAGSKLRDPQAKNYLAVLAALRRPHLTLIGSANPSTLIKLAQFANEHALELIRDIHDGSIAGVETWPDAVRSRLPRSLFRPDPARARELEAVLRRTDHLYPKDCFPHLRMLAVWTGGSVGLYVRHLPDYYGEKVMIRDLGLLASEGRFSIPLENNTPSGVLDVTSHYYEFIPESEIDAAQPTVLTIGEVEVGRNYYLVPTTAYGLYRYQLFDVVQVTGYYHQTPMIAFLSKGAHFSNLTGEKLSEFQVTAAMARALADLGIKPMPYAVAPVWEKDQSVCYGLFVEAGDLGKVGRGEALAASVDRYLREFNVEYDAKRVSGRLGPLRLRLLVEGAWSDWDQERLARTGGTAEQYKRPCLINDPALGKQLPLLESTLVP